MQLSFYIYFLLPLTVGRCIGVISTLSAQNNSHILFSKILRNHALEDIGISSPLKEASLYWSTGEFNKNKFSLKHSSKWKRDVAVNTFQPNPIQFNPLQPSSIISPNANSSNSVQSITDELFYIQNGDFSIKVSPSITFMDSSSVTVILQTNITIKKSKLPNLTDYFRVKVFYRPFGSVLEKKRIILLNNTSLNNKKISTNPFNTSFKLIDLHSNTGYLICFSLINNYVTNTVKIYTNDGKSLAVSAHNNHNNVNDTEKEPKISDLLSTTSTISPSSNHFSKIPPPSPSRTNYAYTSTGELIYLPISSWRPENQRKFRSKRNTTPKSRYCLEVKTLDSSEHFNSFIILISSLSLIGIALVTLILFFIHRRLCHNVCFRKSTKEIQIENSNISTLKYPENSELDSLKNNNGKEIKNPPNANSKINAVQKDSVNISEISQNFKKSHNAEQEEKRYFKRPAFLNLKCINKDLDDFHPGYDLPPSSTVEVYGYDFPRKQDNHSWNLASPAPSSCELNESISSGSFDNVLDKYNINKPRLLPKRSEATKLLNPPVVFPNVPCRKQSPSTSNSNRPIFSESENSPENVEMISRCHEYKTNCSRAVEVFATNNIVHHTTEPTTKPSLYKNIKIDVSKENFEKPKVCSSVGDITISGGTLIEVPEGYVYPKSNPKPVNLSVIKIRIK